MSKDLYQKVVNTISEMLKDKDETKTWWVDLGNYNGNDWAIVMAWMRVDEDSDLEPRGYIGYTSEDSYMREYGYDWSMPSVDGDVYDTDVALACWDADKPRVSKSDAEWLIKEWNETVEDIAKKLGAPVTNVTFYNPEYNKIDRTQFDTTDETELAALWWEFCKENKLIYTEEVTNE